MHSAKWLDLSYRFLYCCLKDKDLYSELERCIHKDITEIYLFIQEYSKDYGEFPRLKKIKEKFNVDLKKYWIGGNTKEIKNELREEYFRDYASSLAGTLQDIATSKKFSRVNIVDQINKYEREIFELVEDKPLSMLDLPKVMRDFKNPDKRIVCKYGFQKLDNATLGISKNEYCVIYAPFSEGKSTFARVVANNIALQGLNVIYLTLEQPSDESIALTASMACHFDNRDFFQGNFRPPLVKRVKYYYQKLKKSGGNIIFIDKVESKSYSFLQSLKTRYRPDIIFLDQITLFTPNNSNEEKHVNQTSKLIRQFTREEDTPIIALSQTKRQTSENYQKKFKEGRQNSNEAHGDNIGYSGAIPQDATTAIEIPPENKDMDSSEYNPYERIITLTKTRRGRKYIHIPFKWDIKNGLLHEL